MSFYNKHVFICDNQKAAGKKCCACDGKALEYFEYMKDVLKDQGLHGEGKVRVSRSGCLGRCRVGPNIVIYPENVWYHYETKEDIDEIIQSHILGGKVVERLLQESSNLLKNRNQTPT